MIATEQPIAISYSGGASSEWIVEAVARGVLPTPARFAVFFADTGGEHDWTYAAALEVEARCASRGVTFIRCRRPGDSLPEHILKAAIEKRSRMDHPPFWVAKDGGARGKVEQRCTREWKTRTLRRAQAAWLKSLALPKRCVAWIGFGADELGRAVSAVASHTKPLQPDLFKRARRIEGAWSGLDFPAIRAGRTRDDQRAELLEWTGRVPGFSMCTFCPFKSPERWRQTEGVNLAQALAVDEAIRDLTAQGIDDGECFLSDRLVPVDVARTLADDDTSAPESHCDGGMCFL